MIDLEWTQVHAWRLAQHHLLERAERSDMLAVIEHIGGLHAQLMSAAELALWARVQDLQADDVQTALWQERTLIKTWAMRGSGTNSNDAACAGGVDSAACDNLTTVSRRPPLIQTPDSSTVASNFFASSKHFGV